MPARLRDVKRVAESDYGVIIEPPQSGSHWKCRKAGCRVYPLPAPNGMRTELDDNYVRGFCRHFGIPSDEFRAKL